MAVQFQYAPSERRLVRARVLLVCDNVSVYLILLAILVGVMEFIINMGESFQDYY